MNDYTAEIERLYNEQEALKRNELEAQKQQALTQVEREQAKVMPTYTAAKQQANVQSQLGAKNLAEYWASRGQTNAGITPQSEMSRQNTLAGQLGQISQQEQQALTGFGEQRADISTQYGSQLASELGQIGIAKSTALYNEKLRQDEEKAARDAAIAKAQADYEQEQYNRWLDQTKMAIAQDNEMFDREMDITNFNYKVSKDAKDGVKGTLDKPIENAAGYGGKIVGWQGDGKGNTLYNIDGLVYKVKNGYSPFTGNKAIGVEFGTLSNGYQPNNTGKVKVAATALTKEKQEVNYLKTTGDKVSVNGGEQNVWKGKIDGKNYIWDGSSNKYKQVTKNKKGQWVVK